MLAQAVQHGLGKVFDGAVAPLEAVTSKLSEKSADEGKAAHPFAGLIAGHSFANIGGGDNIHGSNSGQLASNAFGAARPFGLAGIGMV